MSGWSVRIATLSIIADVAMQSPAPITMTMPTLTSWKPGRTITSVPAKPMISAAQRIG